jgi:hypothetical protein
MKKLNKRESILLIITLCIVIFALAYIYILEPLTKSKFFTNPLTTEYKEYIDLIKNKQQILAEGNKIFSQNYWKHNPQQQQLSLQMHIQNIIKECDIVDIKSILPLQINNMRQYQEIAIQIDIECPLSSLTKFIYKLETSIIPIKIRELKIQSNENNSNSVKSQIQISSIFFTAYII